MNDVMCQEARIIAGVEAAGFVTKGRQSSVSANDLLVNLSWALILILAIAAIVAAGQAQAINDINDVIGTWNDKGKSEAIIEVFRQKLIRKIDSVCASKQLDLNIDLLPDFSRVSTQAGMPDDREFSDLCHRAFNELGSVDDLTRVIYDAALAHTEEGVERMYDPVVFPGTAPDVNAPNVIGNSAKAQEHREFAMSRIRQRCIDWQTHVVQLQRQAVEHMLDSSAVESVRDADRERMTEKIRSTFEAQGYPLLSETL